MFDREAVKYGSSTLNGMSVQEEKSLVEDIVNEYSKEDATEVLENYAKEIAEVMTEEEIKGLILRFLKNGKSRDFVKYEIENYFN